MKDATAQRPGLLAMTYRFATINDICAFIIKPTSESHDDTRKAYKKQQGICLIGGPGKSPLVHYDLYSSGSSFCIEHLAYMRLAVFLRHKADNGHHYEGCQHGYSTQAR